MRDTDTNVTLEMELSDGAKIYSCINGGGTPYIFVNEPDGREYASMHIMNGYTKAEVIAWCVSKHFQYSSNEMMRNAAVDMEMAVLNIFAEERRPAFVEGGQLMSSYSDQNYPEYQNIEVLFGSKEGMEEEDPGL